MRTPGAAGPPGPPGGSLEAAECGGVLWADEGAAAVLGRSPADLAGMRLEALGLGCFSCQAPDEVDRPFHLCADRDVGTVDTPAGPRALLWSCERRGQPGEGRCRISLVDLTGRPDLDVKIFQAKHELEAIFDSITDPSLLVDGTLTVCRANRAMALLTGRRFAQILGRPCGEVLHELGAPAVIADLAQVMETRGRARDVLRAPGGTIYRLHFFPLCRGGRVAKVLVRYQDITAETRLEEQLLQAERMASVGQLSAGIAHEINNPMGFIGWNLARLGEYAASLGAVWERTRAAARAVGEGGRDPAGAWAECSQDWEQSEVGYLVTDLADVVAECRQGAERIQRIIDDLRAFSHPATQRWERTDLHQGLDSTISLVHNELKHRCEVVRAYGELPPVLCSPQKVNQVFLNLLVNAAQAMPERGVLTIRTWAEGERVAVAVCDTGRGIAPEHRARLFDPFFTTKPVGQGTGLGLHLALGIVREHGGEIGVESRVGEGSTFTVWLPVTPPESQRAPAAV